jgi:hypothetical protein
MRKIEEETINFNPEDYNIPGLMMRLKKSISFDLLNIYVNLIEKGEVCKDKLECEIDEKCMETYISYVTFWLQKHIIGKVGNKNNQETNSNPIKTRRKLFRKELSKRLLMRGNLV